jgi:DNA-binding GntR family transcriptional regulator
MYPDEVLQSLEKMKSDITEGIYAQGESLNEIHLAKKYGIKRTRIRQILNELEKLTLVDRVPSKGAFVKIITARDLQEIFELKEALEGMAAKLAARRRRDEQLAEMMAAFYEAKRTLSRTDFEGKIKIGEKLHQFILANCDNNRIVNAMTPLAFQMIRIWNRGINIPERIDKAFKEHGEILAAIRDKDEEKAEIKMKLHISTAYKDYMMLASQL